MDIFTKEAFLRYVMMNTDLACEVPNSLLGQDKDNFIWSYFYDEIKKLATNWFAVMDSVSEKAIDYPDYLKQHSLYEIVDAICEINKQIAALLNVRL